HPQIAQVQWWPLYVLGLVAMVDRMSVPRAVAGVLAVAAIRLAAVDAGAISALMAPVLLAVVWAIRDGADRNPWPFLKPAIPVAMLAAVGAVVLYRTRPDLFAPGAGLGYNLGDIAFFRARWWAYFTPPIENPILGPIAAPVFDNSDVGLQLTEMQLYL